MASARTTAKGLDERSPKVAKRTDLATSSVVSPRAGAKLTMSAAVTLCSGHSLRSEFHRIPSRLVTRRMVWATVSSVKRPIRVSSRTMLIGAGTVLPPSSARSRPGRSASRSSQCDAMSSSRATIRGVHPYCSGAVLFFRAVPSARARRFSSARRRASAIVAETGPSRIGLAGSGSRCTAASGAKLTAAIRAMAASRTRIRALPRVAARTAASAWAAAMLSGNCSTIAMTRGRWRVLQVRSTSRTVSEYASKGVACSTAMTRWRSHDDSVSTVVCTRNGAATRANCVLRSAHSTTWSACHGGRISSSPRTSSWCSRSIAAAPSRLTASLLLNSWKLPKSRSNIRVMSRASSPLSPSSSSNQWSWATDIWRRSLGPRFT